MINAYRLGLAGLVWLIIGFSSINGQVRIDSSFAFQNDPAKRFALYVPSGYTEGTPNKLILALHPFHQAWGNSVTWCDILMDFAETNSLIMICPDGGNDGRIDDPIDKAFFTALLDSAANWYSVNPDKVFILGFSWGARAAYTYGLANHEKFAGFITLGAFINGTDQVTPAMLSNSANKPFYIMHGDQDNIVDLQTGFHPIRNALINNGAIVNSLVLQGVGHTINFPNRDAILTDAFNWVDSVDSDIAVGIDDAPESHIMEFSLAQNYPNPFNPATTITYGLQRGDAVILTIYDIHGKAVRTLVNGYQPPGIHSARFDAESLSSGVYLYRLQVGSQFSDIKKMLLIQ